MRKSSLLPLIFAIASTTAMSQSYYGGVEIGSVDTDINSITNSTVRSDAITVVNASSGQTRTISGTTYTFSNMGVTSVGNSGISSNTNDHVLSTRIFGGYQFSEYLALELGLLYIRDQTTSYTSRAPIGVTGTATSTSAQPMSVTFHQLTRNDTYKQKALDLYVKGMWPITQSFNLMAKVGGALLNNKVQTQLNISRSTDLTIGGTTDTTQLAFSDSYTTKSTKFYPAFGFGGEYHLTSMFDIGLSWNRIMVDSNGLNNINTLYGTILVHF